MPGSRQLLLQRQQGSPCLIFNVVCLVKDEDGISSSHLQEATHVSSSGYTPPFDSLPRNFT
jgi:hypothetical protein